MTAAIENWPGHENATAVVGMLSPANMTDFGIRPTISGSQSVSVACSLAWPCL